MKGLPILLAAILAASVASPSALQGQEPSQLATDVQKLFGAKCGDCHKAGAPQEESPHLVDDLASLNTSDFINRDKPEDSKLYDMLLRGKMPKTTRAEKTEGKRAVPLTPDETQLVLTWIKAGAPKLAVSASPATESNGSPNQSAPQQPGATGTPKPTASPTTPRPLPANRIIVTEAQMLVGALEDLLKQPAEDRADIRYLSIHPQHNNVGELSDEDVWLARCGIRKLLNSLSTNPKIVEFEKTGPELVLHRIRLRDLGWTPELWEKITASYPYVLDSGSLAALAAPTRCSVPMVRADWFAATASRPPLYDIILNHPTHVAELERRLGVDVAGNLAAGDAVRSGFTQSGVSKQNRLVERHDIRAYPGFYWLSYDFKHNSGRGRLADYPLGPMQARLTGGQHAFEHDGGEIIYSLPNGLQAYLLVDGKGQKIDVGPVEVVSDRFDKTGRAQIFNGFSCMACHDKGMKELPLDELRSVAHSAKFGPEAQRLIEKLHPGQDRINAVVKADAQAFQKALAAADVDPAARKEPVLALVDFFENDVSLAQAAADLGMKKDDFEKTLEENMALFDSRTALRGPGVPRVAFVEHYQQMAVRFGLGDARDFENASAAFVQATDHAGVRAERAAGQLGVELRANQATYRKGDLMLFTVRTSEDAFVRLLYQDARGNVKVLLPNAAHDGRIRGGVPVTFGDDSVVNPATGKSFRIRCAPPFGNEMVAAVVSNTPFKDNGDVIKEAAAKGGLADGKRRGKGAELEIVEAARTRSQDARLGVARVFLTTKE
jgi:mono/diheme cytochrome c family protein